MKGHNHGTQPFSVPKALDNVLISWNDNIGKIQPCPVTLGFWFPAVFDQSTGGSQKPKFNELDYILIYTRQYSAKITIKKNEKWMNERRETI